MQRGGRVRLQSPTQMCLERQAGLLGLAHHPAQRDVRQQRAAFVRLVPSAHVRMGTDEPHLFQIQVSSGLQNGCFKVVASLVNSESVAGNAHIRAHFES